MAKFFRLTQEQKIALIKVHETYKGSELSDNIYDAASNFESLPHSGVYFLISKPEVTDEVWNALKKANIGKVVKLENGDSDEDYKKGIEVEKNLLEAILEFLEKLIRAIAKGATGKQGIADGRTSEWARKPRNDAENAYER